MSIPDWLRSFRRSTPVETGEIRRELAAVQQRHAETVRQRDGLALAAVSDEGAAGRWAELDTAASELRRRMDVLTQALPVAEARDAVASRRAEEAERQRAFEAFEEDLEAAQRWLDGVIARLPSEAELTEARDLRNRLSAAAGALRAWSNDGRCRRPLDPLAVLVAAMQHRLDRVSRAQWAKAAPITLGARRSAGLVAAAAERVRAIATTEGA
jgi:hypothetical protein